MTVVVTLVGEQLLCTIYCITSLRKLFFWLAAQQFVQQVSQTFNLKFYH